jgi:Ni,Fe-hydrogenase maturation factor
MSQLEDGVGGRLEAEGCILVETVVEHVLLCFQCQEPQVSLEPVVQGPAEEVEEAAQAGVQDIMRLLAERFER